MNYVFLDIETTGLDYKKDEIILINCKKYDKKLNEIDELELYIKPKNKISKYVEELTKITNKNLGNAYNLKEALEELKKFLSNNYIICFSSEFILSFLLTAIYNTKIDMKFWYIDLLILINEKTPYKSFQELFKMYNIDFCVGLKKYIELTKKYMKNNNIDNLDELTKIRPNKWNILFRGINYPEYLGDCNKYTFYIADLTTEKYPSYLSCLKEIRKEEFSLEELKNLKKKYNIKVLVHILNIDETILKITNDFYITSFGSVVELNQKWGAEYTEKLKNAANFIATHKEKIEITCYDTIKELDEKTKFIDKEIMNKIKSKIVREKNKWSRWN